MSKIIIIYFILTFSIQSFAKDIPNWITDINSFCSKNDICAIGNANTLDLAQIDARRNILRYFETNINSKFISNISSDEKTVNHFTNEDIEDLTKGIIKGVRIVKIFNDKNGFYTLAILDKKIAIKEIKNDIDKIDTQMKLLLQNNNVIQLKKLYIKREDLNKKHLFLTGSLIPEKITYNDIFSNKNDKNVDLVFFIKTSNDFESEIGNYIANLLSDNDFYISNNNKNNNRIIDINIFKKDIEINVKGFIKEIYYLNIKIIDNKTNKIISSLYNEFTDVGRNSLQIQDIVKVKIQYFIEENFDKILK